MYAKVLVVDDDPAIRDVVKLILERNEFEVRLFSGHTGLFETIGIYQPDLILLDVSLSGEDGREVCKRIRQQKSASVAVVLFSANKEMEQYVEECAANDFLAKPFRAG